MNTWIGSFCVLAGVASCGGATPRASDPSTSAQLREQADSNRRTIRDLENQVALLAAKANGPVPAYRAPRVEVLAPPTPVAPEPVAPRPVVEALTFADPGHDQAMVDDEGFEIVYVGEAANEATVELHLPQADRKPTRTAVVVRKPAPKPAPAKVSSPVRSPRRVVAKRGPAKVSGPKELYKVAIGELRGGDHVAAQRSFELFLHSYPKHSYADNAQYWLGEVFYDQNQYRRAIAEFRKVARNFPRGNKAAGALLKAGYCHLAMNDNTAAITTLKKVIADYSGSKPAELAGHKLKELNR